MRCSTSEMTVGNTLEGLTTTLNSSKNAASHSGDSGGCSGLAAAMGGFGAVSAALQVTGPALWVLLSRPALCAAADGDDTAATARQWQKTVKRWCQPGMQLGLLTT
jgi:hypothetical protein